jgi:crotonobetainyl-CoA:carnitine CoA-transferase CaiB-like acyl-CoA transferase
MVTLRGGGQPGIVAGTRALVEWANQDGYMLELKDFDWASVDTETIAQEDADYRVNLLEEFLVTKTKAECLERAVQHSIMLIPVNDVSEVVASPQMVYRGFFEEVEHPELGETITYPGFPVIMAGIRPGVQRRAPLIGEHNEEVYEKELGISREQLVILRNRGVT